MKTKKSKISLVAILLAVLMIAALPFAVVAANYNKPYDGNPVAGIGQLVYLTDEAIEIDGVADEASWAGAQWSSTFMEETSGGFANVRTDADFKLSGTKFKALWNGAYELYLFLDVDDNTYNPDDGFHFLISEDKSTGTNKACFVGGCADGRDSEEAGQQPGCKYELNGSVSWGSQYENRFFTYALKRGAANEHTLKHASKKFEYYVTEKDDHSGYTAECKFYFTYNIASTLESLVNILVDDFEVGQDATLINNGRYTDTPTYYSWTGLTSLRSVGVTQLNIRATDTSTYERQNKSSNAIWPNSLGTMTFVKTLVPEKVASAKDTGVSYAIAKTDAAITVDGTIDEAWAAAEWSTGITRCKKTIGQFKALWKEEGGKRYIYFLLDINDPSDLGAMYSGDTYTQDGFSFQFNELCREGAKVLGDTTKLGYYVYDARTSAGDVNSTFINAESFYGVRRNATMNRNRTAAHSFSNPYFMDCVWVDKGTDPATGDSLGYLVEARYELVTDTDEIWFNVTVIDGDSGTCYYRYNWADVHQGMAFTGEYFTAKNAGILTLVDD